MPDCNHESACAQLDPGKQNQALAKVLHLNDYLDVRRFVGHLIKHARKQHVQPRVAFDQSLKFLDDRVSVEFRLTEPKKPSRKLTAPHLALHWIASRRSGWREDCQHSRQAVGELHASHIQPGLVHSVVVGQPIPRSMSSPGKKRHRSLHQKKQTGRRGAPAACPQHFGA